MQHDAAHYEAIALDLIAKAQSSASSTYTSLRTARAQVYAILAVAAAQEANK